MSRAMVFGAALAASACASKQKQAPPPVQQHPCGMAGPEEIARLEKAVEQAQTEEEKKQAEENLEQAKTTPMCAPYGAPPARRRVV